MNDSMTTVLRPKLLAALVAAALGSLTLIARADTITLAAEYKLPGDTGTLTTPVISPPDFYGYYVEGSDSVFFHTYGDLGNPTYFGARASGEGNFYAKTSALYSASYTNAGASPIGLVLSFYVESGEVGLYGTGIGSADLRLQVRRDGGVVSQGQTTITQTLAGTTCSENDIGVLGNWASCTSSIVNYAYGTGQTFAVDLGSVGAGQTIAIDYDIVATVSGKFTDGAVSSGDCYGGYGEAAAFAPMIAEGPQQCVWYNGIARAGDPFNGAPTNQPADISLTPQNVPEPGSIPLVGAAIAGLWFSRRRRRARHF